MELEPWVNLCLNLSLRPWLSVLVINPAVNWVMEYLYNVLHINLKLQFTDFRLELEETL